MGFKSNILIANEEVALSQMLLMVLGSRGFKTQIVHTGSQAILKAHEQVDLIIIDEVLPDIDGLKLCHILKSDPQTRRIPVVITGVNQAKNKIQSLQLGADDYLAKPFQSEELLARIEGSLRRQEIVVSGNDAPNYQTIQELKDIIQQERVVPYFQPIYSLNPLRLLGVEVLSRPQTTSNLSNPEVLFKEALRYGLYYDLEMVVWKKAIDAAQRVFGKEYLFLNCNPYLIESNRFASVRDLFSDFGMSPKNVFFEITERSAIAEFNLFFDRLSDFRTHGFKIAIDDVGAGYASLESIVQTKPEVVKIDRQIIAGAVEDSFKRSIVKLIVAFCNENDIICIAEGIETKEDFDFLVKIGVFAGQGYYLYRPAERIDLQAMRSIMA